MVRFSFPRQYEVYLVSLDPAVGNEINKTRPCLVISPDEMNKIINTVIIAPMTTKYHKIPTRVNTKFEGKNGWIALDQIKSIDKRRIVKYLGKIELIDTSKVKDVLKSMLID